MSGKKPDWGRCPDCGEELFNISDCEENLVMCTECGKTFPEPPLGAVTKKRKAKKGKEQRLPFGKHKGKSLEIVLAEEPGYLCWFYDAVDGNEEVSRRSPPCRSSPHDWRSTGNGRDSRTRPSTRR